MAWACQLACQLEVAADKPGNVTYHKPFADVAAEQFLASSIAIGPAFRRIADRGVGAVILQAVEDTRYLVDSNTNLGMLLLLAPLARAALRTRPRTFRDRVGAVLEELTVADTADVYRAIRLAMPGGLGGAHRYDVCGETPAVPLQEAMKEAAPRDSVAGEYVTSFATTFSIGLPVLRRALSHGHRLRDAVTQSYLVT
ncbi:MAG: triphosphoribosyl-dephospho-CoA synthase, partial [Synergistales bacterium]|nr:triphosphoribosyl-dephospho-CoA synthase [Synergistales bacterium]